jgi:2-hydroxychromene-2-carboxylate isomerase
VNLAAAPIDFWFDFVSPYGYFAATRIDDLAAQHGRQVRWRPFHMRSIMKDLLGQTTPMLDTPLKGAYLKHDVARMSRWFGLPLRSGGLANFRSANASRAFLLIDERDPAAAKRFAMGVFESHHAKATPPNTPEQLVQIAAERGALPAGLDLEAALALDETKDRLRLATAAAVAAGVWGTPSFVVDGELFWGADRLGLVDEWLRRGGW